MLSKPNDSIYLKFVNEALEVAKAIPRYPSKNTQKKEILCKLIAYNIDRLINYYLIFEGFSRAYFEFFLKE